MLAVIPARGGSKQIESKCLRLVAGKPLVAHALDTLRGVHHIRHSVVSTEDPAIAAVVRLHGGEVINRPPALAADDCPVAPVIQHAVASLGWQGPVLTFQPTSPTLTSQQVSDFLDGWQTSGCVSGGIVTPLQRIVWDDHGQLSNRVNRQVATEHWTELGVFVSAAVPVGPLDPLVGHPHFRFSVLDGIDVDSHDDLEAARRWLGRKSIEFRVICGPRVGLGHVRRVESLAAELAHHSCSVVYEERQ